MHNYSHGEGKLVRINSLGHKVDRLSILHKLQCGFLPIRSQLCATINQPYDEHIGAPLGWIERHSDTCITSLNGTIRTDTETLLCHFKSAYICPVTYSIVLEGRHVVAESHHTFNVMHWIAKRNGLLFGDNTVLFLKHHRVETPIYEHSCFVVNTRWASSNYYHWLHECLPRLILFLSHQNRLTVKPHLIWQGNPNSLKPFHKQSLEVLGVPPSNLVYIETPHIYKSLFHLTFVDPGLVSPYQAQLIKTSCAGHSTLLNQQSDSPARILIQRSQRHARHLLIDNDLMNIFEKHQIYPITLEKLSFAEQINVFSKADLIIAPHGAGLSNIVFSEDATVIELMPSDSVHPLYMQIASSVHLPYAMLVVRTMENTNQTMKPRSIYLSELIAKSSK
jgi:hypothetical protein